jgi:hypothetical protein
MQLPTFSRQWIISISETAEESQEKIMEKLTQLIHPPSRRKENPGKEKKKLLFGISTWIHPLPYQRVLTTTNNKIQVEHWAVPHTYQNEEKGRAWFILFYCSGYKGIRGHTVMERVQRHFDSTRILIYPKDPFRKLGPVQFRPQGTYKRFMNETEAMKERCHRQENLIKISNTLLRKPVDPNDEVLILSDPEKNPTQNKKPLCSVRNAETTKKTEMSKETMEVSFFNTNPHLATDHQNPFSYFVFPNNPFYRATLLPLTLPWFFCRTNCNLVAFDCEYVLLNNQPQLVELCLIDYNAAIIYQKIFHLNPEKLQQINFSGDEEGVGTTAKAINDSKALWEPNEKKEILRMFNCANYLVTYNLSQKAKVRLFL